MSDEEPRGRHRTVGASPRNVRFARQLRKEMSLPEVLLWRELKGKRLGVKFRKQFPVAGYVADFACVGARLLIEVDGIVHDMGQQPEHDEKRDAILSAKGWRVERIAASEVLRGVKAVAEALIRLALSLQPSSPERGGGAPEA